MSMYNPTPLLRILQGGLLHRKVKPKQVTYYPNTTNTQYCLLRLFQEYVRHWPKECDDTFYLSPLRKPKDVWYSKVPVEHNTLSKTVGCTRKQISLVTKRTIRSTWCDVSNTFVSEWSRWAIDNGTHWTQKCWWCPHIQESEWGAEKITIHSLEFHIQCQMKWRLKKSPNWIKGWGPSWPDNPKGQLQQQTLLMDQRALTTST